MCGKLIPTFKNKTTLNYIKQTRQATVALVLLLFILSKLPDIQLFNYQLKKINILSDIQVKNIEEIKLDSTASNAPTNNEFTNNQCNNITMQQPKGVITIEDFSENGKGMLAFVQSVNKNNLQNNKVRIAFYGDSFVEGDIITADLRDTLQALYGGSGIGFVPITSEVSQFRPTITHKYQNWSSYSLLSKTSNVVFGVGGLSFIPNNKSNVLYKTLPKKRFYSSYNSARILYTQSKFANNKITYSINAEAPKTDNLTGFDYVSEFVINNNNITSLTMEFPNPKNLTLFGLYLDNGNGIYIDNFSVRGNSGITLNKISPLVLKETDSLENYKLVFLQFGMNVIYAETKNFDWYKREMTKTIQHIKTSFPNASIILMGVADRSAKLNNEFVTMPSIPLLIEAQKQIAQQTGICFWNTYKAMGGYNSMKNFAESKPALANKDYTHLTFKGGKVIAMALLNSLQFELKKYNNAN